MLYTACVLPSVFCRFRQPLSDESIATIRKELAAADGDERSHEEFEELVSVVNNLADCYPHDEESVEILVEAGRDITERILGRDAESALESHFELCMWRLFASFSREQKETLLRSIDDNISFRDQVATWINDSEECGPPELSNEVDWHKVA